MRAIYAHGFEVYAKYHLKPLRLRAVWEYVTIKLGRDPSALKRLIQADRSCEIPRVAPLYPSEPICIFTRR